MNKLKLLWGLLHELLLALSFSLICFLVIRKFVLPHLILSTYIFVELIIAISKKIYNFVINHTKPLHL